MARGNAGFPYSTAQQNPSDEAKIIDARDTHLFLGVRLSYYRWELKSASSDVNHRIFVTNEIRLLRFASFGVIAHMYYRMKRPTLEAIPRQLAMLRVRRPVEKLVGSDRERKFPPLAIIYNRI